MTDDPPDGPALARRLAEAVRESASLPAARIEAASDPTPTADGTEAWTLRAAGDRVATVAVHPDRVHAEFAAAPDIAAEAARRAGLRVRPKAVRPPRTLAFAESAEEIAPMVGVFVAVRAELG